MINPLSFLRININLRSWSLHAFVSLMFLLEPQLVMADQSYWDLYGKTSKQLTVHGYVKSYCMPCHQKQEPGGINFKKILSSNSDSQLLELLIPQMTWMPPDPELRKALQNKLKILKNMYADK